MGEDSVKCDIFISYRRDGGQDKARKLQLALSAVGYSDIFFDFNSLRDGKFNEKILDAISVCKDFILILSPGSMDRCVNEEDWVRKEVLAAIDAGCNIIPVTIDDHGIVFPTELPKEFDSIKQIQQSKLRTDEFFDDSVRLISERLDSVKKTEPISQSENNPVAKGGSAFKVLLDQDADIFLDGVFIGQFRESSGMPLRLPVPRKGSYVITCINAETRESLRQTYEIGSDEEKVINLTWKTAAGHRGKPAGDSPHSGEPENDLVGIDIPVGDLSFRMIRVDGGSIKVGATPEQGSEPSDNDLPPHEVNVKNFYMGQFPVTEDLWEEVMGKEGLVGKLLKRAGLGAGLGASGAIGLGAALVASPFIIPAAAVAGVGAVAGAGAGAATLLKRLIGKDRKKLQKPYGKAEYKDAVEFVHRLSAMTGLSFSLPTEEEWEYAARGGRRSKGYRYAGGDDADKVAWHMTNAFGMRHPVGQKTPNELGLFDMSGNVLEWTESQLPGSTEFVLRGGSSVTSESDCRVSSRKVDNFFHGITNVTGLRVIIRDLPEDATVPQKD